MKDRSTIKPKPAWQADKAIKVIVFPKEMELQVRRQILAKDPEETFSSYIRRLIRKDLEDLKARSA